MPSSYYTTHAQVLHIVQRLLSSWTAFLALRHTTQQSRTEVILFSQAKTLLRGISQKSQMAKEWILAVKSLWKTSVKVCRRSSCSPVCSNTRLSLQSSQRLMPLLRCPRACTLPPSCGSHCCNLHRCCMYLHTGNFCMLPSTATFMPG